MRPTVQAILLADKVYVDRGSKHIICGVFNALGFKRAPDATKSGPDEIKAGKKNLLEIQDVGNPWAYISLTNVKGKTPLELRFESLTGDRVFFSTEFEVTCEDPLASVELTLPVPRLPHVSGTYVLDLLYEQTSIGSHRVQIFEIKDESN